jgi:tripartite-type tricarboxylate transporter receptor subunit TctC
LRVNKGDWLRDRKIKVVLQDLPERSPDLPDVPCLVEFGRNDDEKQVLALYGSGGAIGRSFMAPPGLPPETAKTLRSAFVAMTQDAEFKAEVQKSSLEVDPVAGDALAGVVAKSLEVPERVRERAKSVFGR